MAQVEIAEMGLRDAEVWATASQIASVQLATGMIPWFRGGHADPWNHTEAAMALALGGLVGEAERAYEWLVARQAADGSWCSYYLAAGVEEPRRDTNMCAYVATGAWFHFLLTGDSGFLEALWPVMARAVDFVLGRQRVGGEIAWSVDPDGMPAPDALLAASSSIHLSLRCALAAARQLGWERPNWEHAADRLGDAIAGSPGPWRSKRRWSMDWYYPVLAGGISKPTAARRMASRWDDLVIEGVGVRCVSDQPWVTAAETAECAMALDNAGLRSDGVRLLAWTRSLRHHDGSYWTGAVHPGGAHFPGGERSTYSAAAVLLADHALFGSGPSASLFRDLRRTCRLPQDDSGSNNPEAKAARQTS